MKMKNFENILIQMTKPEVLQLKHQDILANAIIKAKEKSVVSWWWLSIPLYIIATLLMKALFMPGTNLISNIHELTGKAIYPSILFFLFLPVVFITINFMSIRKVYLLSGSTMTINFIRTVWLNALIILFSILVLLIYLL